MLRNARLITTLAAILFTLSLGLPAVAKTSYPNHIPNGGVNSCDLPREPLRRWNTYSLRK